MTCSRRGAFRHAALATALLAGALAAVGTTAPAPADAAPAPGFSDTPVLTGLTNPMTVRFSPDGRVFVAEKSGLIKVFDGLGDPTPTVFADLRTKVHNFWDRGLLGLALHPSFPAQPWVYVMYTHDAAIGGTAPRYGTAGATSDPCPTPPGPTADGCVVSGRVSRLLAACIVISGSEQVLVEDWCQQYPSHSVGDLEFGVDGALYASGGEGASFTFTDYGQDGSPTNPCGDPPVPVGGTQSAPTAQGGALRAQDARTDTDPLGLDGTVIRIDPQTGAGLPGNPWFASTDPNARRVVATGLRNPFRMALRPGTSELWVGDVGNGEWEELNRIATPADATADNFGWPCYEGTARLPAFDSLDLTLCENLYAAGTATGPAFAYRHDQPVVAGETCPLGSSSLSGIEFYEGGAYPATYDNATFFADYSRDCIWALVGGTPQTLVAGAGNPVDLELGPGGDLFYVNFDGGAIHRVTWTQPQPPTASAYLSDLAWLSADNGWGTVERDTSNGEQLTGDGTVLRLDGTAYDKGLGVHALSEVRFDLGGNCTRFQSDIGIDDEVGAGGSVTFEVWADGVLRHRSVVLTATSATQQVDLPISGVHTLRLVADGGADVTTDHADWAAARVTCGSDTTAPTVTARSPLDGAVGVSNSEDITASFSEPLDATTVDAASFTLIAAAGSAPVPAVVSYDAGTHTARLDPSGPLADTTTYVARLTGGPDAVADLAGNRNTAQQQWSFTTTADAVTTTHLSDRPWTSSNNGWGPVELDHSNGENAAGDGGSLTLGNQTYTKGLGAHARSTIAYDLAGDCTRFQADIGIDDEITAGGSATFEVLGDGTRLHLSPVMTASSATRQLDLPVTGVRELRLVIDPGADIDSDHADWADARVTCGSAAVDPEVHIATPTVATRWAVGDEIDFTGGATDSRGEPVAASALTWTLVQRHCPSNCHSHTIQSWDGVASGTFFTPDHEFPSHLELVLTAALAGGGSVSDSIELHPRTTTLTMQSQPPGLVLGAGQSSWVAPFSREVIVGSANSLSAAATQVAGSTTHNFVSWSDGGARSHDVVAPGTPATYTARYAAGAPATISGTVTESGVGDPLAGAFVAVLHTSDFSIAAGTLTDANGNYRNNVGPGTYYVYVIDPTGRHGAGFHGAPTAITVGVGQGVDVDPQRASTRGSVRGAITGTGPDTRIAGSWAVALTNGGVAETGVVADGSGQFTLPGLNPGNHYIAYIDPSGAHPTRFFPNSPNVPDATTVAVTSGGSTVANGSLPTQTAVGTGAALTGTVTEEGTGTPLANAFVVALRAADFTMARGGVTNGSGAYDLNVAAGTYKLLFFDPTGLHNPEWNNNLPASNLGAAAPVNAPGATHAALGRNTGSISGTVTDDPSSSPLAGVWVLAIGPTGISGGTATAANGTYSVTGLPPGTYRVTFADPNGGRTQEYFDNAADFVSATTVTITAGTAGNELDGQLSLP